MHVPQNLEDAPTQVLTQLRYRDYCITWSYVSSSAMFRSNVLQ